MWSVAIQSPFQATVSLSTLQQVNQSRDPLYQRLRYSKVDETAAIMLVQSTSLLTN